MPAQYMKSELSKYVRIAAALCMSVSLCGCGGKKKDSADENSSDDHTPPVIACKADYSIPAGSEFDISKACEYSDNETDHSDLKISMQPEPDTDTVGKHTVSINIADDAGNVAYTSLTYEVTEAASSPSPTPESTPTPTPESTPEATPEPQQSEQQNGSSQHYSEPSYQEPVYTPEPTPVPTPAPTPVPSTPAPAPVTPSKPADSASVKHFAFSDGYTMDSAYNACVAAGTAHGSYSCTPYMNNDGTYAGYELKLK